MKVGDLVRAPFWPFRTVGIIINTERLKTSGVVKVFGSFGWEVEVEGRFLEVIKPLDKNI